MAAEVAGWIQDLALSMLAAEVAAEQRRALQQRLRHHSRALNTCAGGALITATSSSCSRALNTCAGGALMGGGANSLRTAIPGSPARCGGAALTGGAR